MNNFKTITVNLILRYNEALLLKNEDDRYQKLGYLLFDIDNVIEIIDASAFKDDFNKLFNLSDTIKKEMDALKDFAPRIIN